MKQPTSQTKNKSEQDQHLNNTEQKDKQKKNEVVVHHYNGVAYVRINGGWVILSIV